MGDLLLRGIEDALKVELQESARRNGRSLSDEAITHIRSALSKKQRSAQTAGARLRFALGEVRLEDNEVEMINSIRKHSDRQPPDFG